MPQGLSPEQQSPHVVGLTGQKSGPHLVHQAWSVQGCILQDLPEWALFLIYRKAAYRRHDLLTLSVLVNANSKTRVGTWHCPSLFDHGTILSQMGQGWGEVGEAELIKYGIEPCLCLKF